MTARLFFSYSHRDEDLRNELQKHLVMLQRQGLIEIFHDRMITAGNDLDLAIDTELEKADIILFLVSPDFLTSSYCYDIEVRKAMQRHELGDASVIPVILRPCDWTPAPFGNLLATPTDGKPVTKWANLDEAFLDISKAIRQAAESLTPAPEVKHNVIEETPFQQFIRGGSPRSANLVVTKSFSDRDKDKFLHETFDYIANYMENSLAELERRNEGIETSFRRIDANTLTATIYQQGDKRSFARIFLGGLFGGRSINVSSSEHDNGNSMNDSLSVEADEHSLFIKALGWSMMSRGDEEKKLTQEGAAEYYWRYLMQPLQTG